MWRSGTGWMHKAVLGILFTSAICLAQVESGRIVGSVTDPNQASIPQATVTVTNNATKESATVNTNEQGGYTVTPLNPGTYTVTVKAAGFETAIVQNVEVDVNQSARADVRLQIGSTATTIEVTAAAPLLNSESASLGTVVTNTEIVNLPLNGRSFYDLAKLTPGAATLPGGGNLLRIRANYISGTAISGVRGVQTSFLLDGVDVTDHHQGGTMIQTSIDALQEFSVQQNAYSAEFGSAGGMLNMTTKSGSDRFHGGLFEFIRNDDLDARDFFSPGRQALKRNQFGGDIGGPLSLPRFLGGKGKTFFFVDYEGMRQRQGDVFNDIVPTAAEKRGDFSAPGLNTIYDPLTTTNGTRTAFPREHHSRQPAFSASSLLQQIHSGSERRRKNCRFCAFRASGYRSVYGSRRPHHQRQAPALYSLELGRLP